MSSLAYRLYLLFTISFFLHLGGRVIALGIIRFDLINIAIITALLVASKTNNPNAHEQARTTKILFLLMVYVILTVPFVRWPGSVLRHGISDWIKAAIFYFFTIGTITTEKRLRTFLFVFMACQLFRVAEPLYLHMAYGYWGLRTNMGGVYMDRLSGAPLDVINSNGLAEVIVTVFLFLHYHASLPGARYKLLYVCSLPMLLYALVLTASRSGMIAMAIIVAGIIVASKKKILLVMLVVATVVVGFAHLTPMQKDRYLSLFEGNVPGSTTATDRIEGWKSDFFVGMQRPLVGHGLGTSMEAEFHATGRAQISHNLYTEVFIELGLLGEIIFVAYLVSVSKNFIIARRKITQGVATTPYLQKITTAMQIWLVMMLIFSLASYGLSSYEWYLFGGLSVALLRISRSAGDVAQDRVYDTTGAKTKSGYPQGQGVAGSFSHNGSSGFTKEMQ